MKKDLTSVVLEKTSSLALSSLKLSANSTCMLISHQPNQPENLKKFKKKID